MFDQLHTTSINFATILLVIRSPPTHIDKL